MSKKQLLLKSILHSKRANIYYLEKCRVMVKSGRVLYVIETQEESLFWNIPIANTTVILLGIGTSITHSAVRMLSSAGVLIGFTGSGGTPLISATSIDWMCPQNEYRPTEYMQAWMSFWFDEKKRLHIAKKFQKLRIDFLQKVWSKDRELKDYNFCIKNSDIIKAIDQFTLDIDCSEDVTQLLLAEALFTKSLYKIAVNNTKHSGFIRDFNCSDRANSFLSHGNYLAYGLAATTLWVLGISHSFAVLHGKTRRGALVFDVADLIKDSLILPWAFICAKEDATEQEFRSQCLLNFTKHDALGFLFDSLKDLSLNQDFI